MFGYLTTPLGCFGNTALISASTRAAFASLIHRLPHFRRFRISLADMLSARHCGSSRYSPFQNSGGRPPTSIQCCNAGRLPAAPVPDNRGGWGGMGPGTAPPAFLSMWVSSGVWLRLWQLATWVPLLPVGDLARRFDDLPPSAVLGRLLGGRRARKLPHDWGRVVVSAEGPVKFHCIETYRPIECRCIWMRAASSVSSGVVASGSSPPSLPVGSLGSGDCSDSGFGDCSGDCSGDDSGNSSDSANKSDSQSPTPTGRGNGSRCNSCPDGSRAYFCLFRLPSPVADWGDGSSDSFQSPAARLCAMPMPAVALGISWSSSVTDQRFQLGPDMLRNITMIRRQCR